MIGLIIENNADILDLYNVDYVCKVSFVDGDFILEKLDEFATTEKESPDRRQSGLRTTAA